MEAFCGHNLKILISYSDVQWYIDKYIAHAQRDSKWAFTTLEKQQFGYNLYKCVVCIQSCYTFYILTLN